MNNNNNIYNLSIFDKYYTIIITLKWKWITIILCTNTNRRKIITICEIKLYQVVAVESVNKLDVLDFKMSNTYRDCIIIIIIAKHHIIMCTSPIVPNSAPIRATSMIWVDVISILVIHITIYIEIYLILEVKIIHQLCTSYFVSSLLNFINHTLPDEFDFMGYNFAHIFDDIIEQNYQNYHKVFMIMINIITIIISMTTAKEMT